jgi:AcrR family transcriptional regulator
MSRDHHRSERHSERRRGPRGRHRGDPGLIWARPEPGSRQPRHTRERIAAAALAIADQEGLEAVSMRRIAQALGAGTMTLYHYIRTKDDLLALMDDAIMGEVLVPDEALTGTWREALSAIARSSRAAFQRHPWALDGLRGVRVGPNGMRHMEQSLGAVSSLDLEPWRKLELITGVDDYVFGFMLRERLSPVDEVLAEEGSELFTYLKRLLDEGDYPHIKAFMGDAEPRAFWSDLMANTFGEDRFENGLQQLLDGVELALEKEGVLERRTGGSV